MPTIHITEISGEQVVVGPNITQQFLVSGDHFGDDISINASGSPVNVVVDVDTTPLEIDITGVSTPQEIDVTVYEGSRCTGDYVDAADLSGVSGHLQGQITDLHDGPFDTELSYNAGGQLSKKAANNDTYYFYNSDKQLEWLLTTGYTKDFYYNSGYLTGIDVEPLSPLLDFELLKYNPVFYVTSKTGLLDSAGDLIITGSGQVYTWVNQSRHEDSLPDAQPSSFSLQYFPFIYYADENTLSGYPGGMETETPWDYSGVSGTLVFINERAVKLTTCTDQYGIKFKWSTMGGSISSNDPDGELNYVAFFNKILTDEQSIEIEEFFINQGFNRLNISGTGLISGFAGESYMLDVPRLDLSQATSLNSTFHGCHRMISFDTTDLLNVTDLDYTWYNCGDLTSFPEIQISPDVTSLVYTFSNMSDLTGFPLIDTSNITDFTSTWASYNGSGFPLIDTSAGTNFNATWRFNTNIHHNFPPLDMSNGTGFYKTWSNCNFTGFPPITLPSSGAVLSYTFAENNFTFLEAPTLGSATSLRSTWDKNGSLTGVAWFDSSEVQSMVGTWSTCDLRAMPALDYSNCESLAAIFRSNVNLTGVPPMDVRNSTDMTFAFMYNSSLIEHPEILNASKVKSWFACFFNAVLITDVPPIDVRDCELFRFTWGNCLSLTGFPPNVFDNWTGTPLERCFENTWLSCPLTPESVENIFNSINVSNQIGPASNNQIDVFYDDSLGVPDISGAISGLKANNWVPKLNGITL